MHLKRRKAAVRPVRRLHERKGEPPIKDTTPKTPPLAQFGELIGMDEALERLKTTRSTFYRLLRSGKLKGMKVGRQWRFELREIERFLKGEAPHIDVHGNLEPLIAALEDELQAVERPAMGLPADTDVQRTVSLMIELALALDASDIHLAPHVSADDQEAVAALRYRVTGVLQPVAEMDVRLLPALVEQWKILACCDTHDCRPQEGRITFTYGDDGERVDGRVGFLPTGLGESVTARLFRRKGAVLSLDSIPYAEADAQRLRQALRAPWGLIVVTGPAGCGKTTVLYSCLREIAEPGLKVSTIEDPIEMHFPWVVQTQIDAKNGLTYPAALRAVLRSDPDVIVLGEVRDPETLDMALRAAVEGHLVLTTFHCTDAASVLQRMVEMGAEPFAVSEATRLVMAQRLVRVLCTECSTKAKPPKTELDAAAAWARAGGLDWQGLAKEFKKPVGCDACRQMGFKGRTTIAETLEVTPAIAETLRKGASVEELCAAAVAEGMTTMAADGVRRAAAGETTLAEVMRILPSSAFANPRG